MTCTDCQAQIFEQELDRDAIVHLTACEECRELEREVRLNAEALASMREDVIPVRPKKPVTQPWHWGVAVAAAMISAFLMSYEKSEDFAGPRGKTIVAKLPEAIVPVPVIAGMPGLLLPAPPVVFPKMQLPPPPATSASSEGQSLLVNIVSDDPDVVIYWLIDPVQGEQVL